MAPATEFGRDDPETRKISMADLQTVHRFY